MSCDAFCYVEYVSPYSRYEAFAKLDLPRDYLLFGLMAGVRGPGPAVANPRGLPSDVSSRVKHVAAVKEVALGGVLIGFHDREAWLQGATGASMTRRRTSDVLQRTDGTDVLLSKKQLSINAPEFIALLRARLDAVKGD